MEFEAAKFKLLLAQHNQRGWFSASSVTKPRRIMYYLIVLVTCTTCLVTTASLTVEDLKTRASDFAVLTYGDICLNENIDAEHLKDIWNSHYSGMSLANITDD